MSWWHTFFLICLKMHFLWANDTFLTAGNIKFKLVSKKFQKMVPKSVYCSGFHSILTLIRVDGRVAKFLSETITFCELNWSIKTISSKLICLCVEFRCTPPFFRSSSKCNIYLEQQKIVCIFRICFFFSDFIEFGLFLDLPSLVIARVALTNFDIGSFYLIWCVRYTFFLSVCRSWMRREARRDKHCQRI